MRRREFLAAVPMAALLTGSPAESSRIVIAPASEPGQPLLVSGVVYAADGKTPAAGVVLELYHTDARGYYSIDGKNEREHRLKGRLATDAQGRYEFRSIKPGSYPNRGAAAHVHVSVGGKDVPEYWFDGDPFLTKEHYDRNSGLGRFSAILKLERGKDGVLRGTRDFRLEGSR